MTVNYSAPWHKESFDNFIQQRLPKLLAERLPLGTYQVQPTDTRTCRVKISFLTGMGEIELSYDGLPQPDEEGVFEIGGNLRVVLPLASREELDVAEIRCVGEQLYDFIEKRLGQAPRDITWDINSIRAWFPLDTWMREFFTTEPSAEGLDNDNWLAYKAQLRMIFLPDRVKLITAVQFGRVCPIETPQGTNIGRSLHVAVGATIRNGRFEVTDSRPEATLGFDASMVPFLEHNDPSRQLMGALMMRQWLDSSDPEPAIIRTGNEPLVPEFWRGRNLLTAFMAWDANAFEDSIVISESCAKRLHGIDYDPRSRIHTVEPGDKLSNRHGSAGTVSRIFPDDQMPHLPDGTPVELIFSFLGIHTRLNFGQIREAVWSRIAKAEGNPILVPPFHAPDEKELRERMRKVGLPESGMEYLTMGRDGKNFPRPTTVGWVYWGLTHHISRHKIHTKVRDGHPQRHGFTEFNTLKGLGATETLREHFNTRNTQRPDANTLADRVTAGKVEQAAPPSPMLNELCRRLNRGGIRLKLTDAGLTCRFVPPEETTLKLAISVPHPWLPSHPITEIGDWEDCPIFKSLGEVNTRLARMLDRQMPEALVRPVIDQLRARVDQFFDALITAPCSPQYENNFPDRLFPDQPELLYHSLMSRTWILFTGRSVLSPGSDLQIDQVGLAEEIAWILFGPQLIRELGDEDAVRNRNETVARKLDEIMVRSWVIVNRAPTSMPTSFQAFHPVRIPDKVIRLHPLATRCMNGDFDGDQVAVSLPVTDGGQREAETILSIKGHLKRDPSLVDWLVPLMESLWGLAERSLTTEGRCEINDLATIEVETPEGFITRKTLTQAMLKVLERDGMDKTLEVLDRLTRRGFELSKVSGASISPFIGETLDCPKVPEGADPAEWETYSRKMTQALVSRTDFSDSDLGPQLLAVKCGARGNMKHLAWLIGGRGISGEILGESVVVRHGLRDGLTPREYFLCTIGARIGLEQLVLDDFQLGLSVRMGSLPTAYTLLARAFRSSNPGMIFALAAQMGEVDPLTDLETRLFVGLPPKV
jgi:hypothetical protein